MKIEEIKIVQRCLNVLLRDDIIDNGHYGSYFLISKVLIIL